MSPKCPTIAAIQAAVAARFRVTVLDLLSARRGVACARPRQAAMWLCRHATLHTLSEIGRQFGDRDHKTVLNAIRRADGLIAGGGEFADAATGLLARLREDHSGRRIAA
jgi:chromosomal replication initiator protein